MDRTPTGFHTRRIRHQSEIVNQAITVTIKITITIIEPEPSIQQPEPGIEYPEPSTYEYPEHFSSIR